jgi:hypothetical protein
VRAALATGAAFCLAQIAADGYGSTGGENMKCWIFLPALAVAGCAANSGVEGRGRVYVPCPRRSTFADAAISKQAAAIITLGPAGEQDFSERSSIHNGGRVSANSPSQ